ncbi:6-carboxytetrahydropterin synthase [Acanthopleuribacter pedis]|uniref:6-carboxy-5,6,7,8-tetrahydropterin synthase n=1 Tax=Acanthopleuribacter pedis TaxID=442870 RepID=A0A8J7U659_9BACT|nr:6-carboxytetrahydropterin synthase [Acanthopleuribacter pedis]MBO1320016.1 6-carboxytetrahydropterin synthase [Acanthopleuribacter pedis]
MFVDDQEYEIVVSVQKHFHASHALPARPELHGHLWEVEFSVSGPLDPRTGMVHDMLDLAKFFDPYVKELDGCNLHECPQFTSDNHLVNTTQQFPTCDTLAHYFLWRLQPIFREDPRFHNLNLCEISVSIWEEDKSARWGRATIRPKLR